MTSLFAFALLAFIGIVTPGPTVLLALTNGSRYGLRRASIGMAGAVVSDFVLIGAVALGLGVLLATSTFWFMVIKWLGVAYLAYLGVRMLMSKGSLSDVGKAAVPAASSARSLFLTSFLVAVTNPKGYLFFTAFLPQFVVPGEAQAPQYAILAVLFASIDLAVMFGYAALGARALGALSRRAARWLDRICGGAFLVLAGSLALYRRSGP